VEQVCQNLLWRVQGKLQRAMPDETMHQNDETWNASSEIGHAQVCRLESVGEAQNQIDKKDHGLI
jgi:hypothetical protein